MNCRTCKWSQWQRTTKGGIQPKIAGRCVYIVEWPPIPAAQIFPRTDKNGIWPGDGKDCPCYAPDRASAKATDTVCDSPSLSPESKP